MKLRDSLEIGGHHLLGWLDPERDYHVTGSWAITHDLGRWWDAMLRLEAATGFSPPEHLEAASLRNLQWLTDNPDGLLWVPPDLDWQIMKFDFHSLREGILAFAALVRYRDNSWAREAGHRYLETLWRALKDDFSWDVQAFHYANLFTGGDNEHPGHTPGNENRFQRTCSHGRCIEALVWFYLWTEDSLALEFADRLAHFHLTYACTENGSIPVALKAPDSQPGDRQSYLYTLCGLLTYGVLTHQSEFIDAVVRTYEVGIPEIVNECGWVGHDLGLPRFPDETGNPLANTESTGAAARLALWVAIHTGRPGCYDDVERLVRARLFPGQTTEADIEANPDAGIEEKAIGGWGENDYPHAGKRYNPSGTAEIVHTMSAIYERIYSREEAGLFINMHFDYEDEEVQVVVERGDEGALTVIPQSTDDLFVRIPRWTPVESVRLSIDGSGIEPWQIGSYAYLKKELLRPECRVVMTHSLPVRRTSETMPAGDTYEFAWKGDEITGISPNGKPVPFYPTLEAD